eukprot:6194404-Pleurochrysis_carterae.AAC.4
MGPRKTSARGGARVGAGPLDATALSRRQRAKSARRGPASTSAAPETPSTSTNAMNTRRQSAASDTVRAAGPA